MHRMVELAIQAGLKKEPSGDREYIGDFDWREFGQLIVNECIDICKEQGNNVAKAYGPARLNMSFMANDCAAAIKERLTIKERFNKE